MVEGHSRSVHAAAVADIRDKVELAVGQTAVVAADLATAIVGLELVALMN